MNINDFMGEGLRNHTLIHLLSILYNLKENQLHKPNVQYYLALKRKSSNEIAVRKKIQSTIRNKFLVLFFMLRRDFFLASPTQYEMEL